MISQEQTATQPGARWALTVLLLAYILSFIDRNAMAILVGPIRRSFDITDFQYGLLHGLAFTVFYTLVGLPWNRRVVLVGDDLWLWIGADLWRPVCRAHGGRRRRGRAVSAGALSLE
ncbi:MAG: hypothetical protein JRF54_09160 [Deltaproteobacteria bacterium]|nr:hypothetical protein [Deltaproteobacteria bacterium]